MLFRFMLPPLSILAVGTRALHDETRRGAQTHRSSMTFSLVTLTPDPALAPRGQPAHGEHGALRVGEDGLPETRDVVGRHHDSAAELRGLARGRVGVVNT